MQINPTNYTVTVKTFPTGGWDEGELQVGHAFIELSAPGREVVVIGYYPIVHEMRGSGTVRDDSKSNDEGGLHASNWSKTFTVSERQYRNMIEYAASVATNSTDNYNAIPGAMAVLPTLNLLVGSLSNVCTDFARNVLAAGDITPTPGIAQIYNNFLPQSINSQYAFVSNDQYQPEGVPAGSLWTDIDTSTQKLWAGIRASDPTYTKAIASSPSQNTSFTVGHFGPNGTVTTYSDGSTYMADPDNGVFSWSVPNASTGKWVTTTQNFVTNVTTVTEVPIANKVEVAVLTNVQKVTTNPITTGSMAGKSLITTTNTTNAQVSYRLQSADGTESVGVVSTNGNVSFSVDRTVQVFKGNAYVGSFSPVSGSGTLANGTTGSFSYDATTGLIRNTVNSVGGSYVNGFTSVQTSATGSVWTAPVYNFANVDAATNADHAAWEALSNGTVDKNSFTDIVNSSTDFLVNFNSVTAPSSYTTPDLSPIGAFYESRSVGSDIAASVAGRTFRILSSAGSAINAAQVAALDANRDGKLGGSELNGLTGWGDSNEDGISQAYELTPLATAMFNAGLTSIGSNDYAFYTSGNAVFRTSDQSLATAPGNFLVTPLAPASRYAVLRSVDNRFNVNANLWIDWAANQVKISSDQANLIGTDYDDNFDIGYYAAYQGKYFNLDLIQNFYAGGGNDVMGGSTRSDNLWGGTGNDTLHGYAGDDKLYGEEGNDEIQSGVGNDTLDGGAGNDRLFGQVGNDALYGGNGDDVMMGFTASNEAKQTLVAGESDDDTMSGGFGADAMYGGLGNDVMDGASDNDLVVGGAGNDTLFGGAGDDEVDGGTGDDVIDGGLGTDKMFGGVGNDQMWGGEGNDIMIGFTPTNDVKQTLVAGETDDDVIYAGGGDDFVLGGMGADLLWAGVGNDELQGGEGNDFLYGEVGNDRLFGGAGDDVVYGGSGDDVIVGGVASNEAALAAGASDNNSLYGGAGSDVILGGVGNDYIDGGAGADDMEGGKGNDIYIVNSVNDVILEQQSEGYDAVVSSTNYILNANIEELRLVEGGTINGTGNGLANRIVGNAQDNILDGVTGADSMVGGLGNDTYYVDNVGDQVVELAGEGADTVNSSVGYAMGANAENLTLLDFSKAEAGIADGTNILVYGYPKANELDYIQGNAVAGFKGTCALTSIANLATQANQALSEAQVVQRAIDNKWAVSDPGVTDYQRGGSNYLGQQALLDSYGIRNGIVMGYNEQGIANLIKGGRGVIIGLNAGKLWDDSAYVDGGGTNHVVTVTGVACDATSGSITGFYIADSGRGLVGDMTRYIPIEDFRKDANVAGAYAIYTIDPIKFWEENLDGTGNELDNLIAGNRGNNVLTGGKGNDTLTGQAGNDTYRFSRGDGRDTIVDSDATTGNLDTVTLTNVNQNNLWFKHVGSDLQIDVLGSSDQIIVRNWYAAPDAGGLGNHVERITTADGLTMYDTDVEQLVQAMAVFAPPSAAQTSWTHGETYGGRVLLTVTH